MGNQREIRQVSPREGLGALIGIPSHGDHVIKLLDEAGESGTFYTIFCPAGDPTEIPNLDGPYLHLEAQPCDHVAIQSGGKMWCGYEAFVAHVRALAPHLEDALLYVGDEEDYIDELRLLDGQLQYRRVHEGNWWSVADYLRAGSAARYTESGLMSSQNELITELPRLSATISPPLEVVEFGHQDFPSGSEQCICAFQGLKQEFESGLHFWVKTLQAQDWEGRESYFMSYAEKGLCQLISSTEFARLVAEYSISLRKPLPAFIRNLDGFQYGLRMYSEWNDIGAMAELAEAYVAFYWSTTA